MTFNMTTRVRDDFEKIMLKNHGESVSYYVYSPTYSSEGYLLTNAEPSATSIKAMISTFTQKDKQEFDLGNISIDDHKGYIPSTVTPKHGDEILRADGERYEVLEILHEHAVAGTKTYYTVHLKRRP